MAESSIAEYYRKKYSINRSNLIFYQRLSTNLVTIESTYNFKMASVIAVFDLVLVNERQYEY